MFLNDFLQTKSNVAMQVSVLTECASKLLEQRTLVLATPDMWPTELRHVLVRFISVDTSTSI